MTTAAQRLDRLQRRRAVLGFGYAVLRKYLDDEGGRAAALITYYGFLSVFPAALLAQTIVTRVLQQHPELRQRVITAMVPPSLQATVDDAVTGLPAGPVALAVGVAGLVLSGTGVVRAASVTLNHVAAVPYRARTGIGRYVVRVVAALAVVLAGAVTMGFLVAAAPSRLPGVAGELATSFAVLLLVARLLLDRPAPLRALWPAAAGGAAATTVVLELGAAVLPEIVRRAGPVYGAFATVAGMFTLLYALSIALVVAAEAAAVHHARLWPRSLDPERPTSADRRALALLAREQERLPGQRIESRWASPSFAAGDDRTRCPEVHSASPDGPDGSGRRRRRSA